MRSERQSQGAAGKIAAILLFLGACVAALYWFVVLPAQQIATGPANELPVAAQPEAALPLAVVETAQPDGEVSLGSVEPAASLPAPQAQGAEENAGRPVEDADSQTAALAPDPFEAAPEAEFAIGEDAAPGSEDAQPPQTQIAQEATEPAPETAERDIGLDVVRVQPDGSAVVAGFAPSGGDVLILVDGSEVARAQADGQGKFVALFDIPRSDEPRSLSLGIKDQLGKVQLAKASVLIAPVEGRSEEDRISRMADAPAPGPDPETALLDEVRAAIGRIPDAEDIDGRDIDGRAGLAAAPVSPDQAGSDAFAAPTVPVSPQIEAPEVPSIAAAPLASLGAPELLAATDPAPSRAPAAAPTIVLADETGVSVLQAAPQPPAPRADLAANVVIDTIAYDKEGEVAVTGRGAADRFVRVYLDDLPVKEVDVGADGRWATLLPGIEAGVYHLRIDELDRDGNVTSRVETPFQRERPELAVGASGAITVQTGFTLWAIAEANFGDGALYVRIYDANRHLIRDPDLIYPGQVFKVPKDAQDG